MRKFHHRIRIIYVKELVDILRDRRTLIAMIVVPIVLYPLLMLGSIQAVSYQTATLDKELFVIAVPDEEQKGLLGNWIEQQKKIAEQLKVIRRSQTPYEPEDTAEADFPDLRADIQSLSGLRGSMVPRDQWLPALDELIRDRKIHLGLIIEEVESDGPIQYRIQKVYDKEEIRSATASYRVGDLIQQRGEWMTAHRLNEERLPLSFVEPFVVERHLITSPGSVLGQILPLILVLMTITGAIYPAIDLTAGERERGTLETLMVCPISMFDLVVGKFLVVTTVAIMGAALNLGSVSATVYFGGFTSILGGPGHLDFPLHALPLILLALIPFAILMSAIMMAVCCFARTFKEAQNYVTPVILAVLIPGGIAALPTSRLEGVMLVLPVANMVMLTRDLLLGATISAGAAAWVMLSTCIYAATAVAIAARIFGSEAVVFSDNASIGSFLRRSGLQPSSRPSLTMSAIVVALLFPIWFYVQSGIQNVENHADLLTSTAQWMPVFFVLFPLAVCVYFKVDTAGAFTIRLPTGRHMFAAVLIGCTSWLLAYELNVLQNSVFAMPEAVHASGEIMKAALAELSPWMTLLALAIVPAFCEEALFRGFLLSGLSTVMRKWPAIVTSAVVFGLFHYYVFKFPVTTSLGVVLAYLCWQSRSILPAIILHALHNGITTSMVLWPEFGARIGLPTQPGEHAPWFAIVIALIVFGIGVMLIKTNNAVIKPHRVPLVEGQV